VPLVLRVYAWLWSGIVLTDLNLGRNDIGAAAGASLCSALDVYENDLDSGVIIRLDTETQ